MYPERFLEVLDVTKTEIAGLGIADAYSHFSGHYKNDTVGETMVCADRQSKKQQNQKGATYMSKQIDPKELTNDQLEKVAGGVGGTSSSSSSSSSAARRIFTSSSSSSGYQGHATR